MMNYNKFYIILFFLFGVFWFCGASVCHEQAEDAEKIMYDAIYNPVTNYWGSMTPEQYEQLNADVHDARNVESVCLIIGGFWIVIACLMVVRPYIYI